MFYEIGRLNKTGKYAMGQKHCIDIRNEYTIFVKSHNLKRGYSPFCACASFVYVFCFDPH